METWKFGVSNVVQDSPGRGPSRWIAIEKTRDPGVLVVQSKHDSNQSLQGTALLNLAHTCTCQTCQTNSTYE